jgi:hypothetical protein
MSAIAAIALALLAGLYVGVSDVREVSQELPDELDARQLGSQMEAEAAAHLAWSRAAGELRAEEDGTEREET